MEPQQPVQQSSQNDPNKPVTPTPTAVPGVENTNSTQAPEAKGSKRKLVIVIIAIAVFLLLAGGSAAAYFLVYLPNTPENVLLQALYNTTSKSELKSGKLDGTLKVSGGEIPPALGDIDVTASFAENGDMGATLSTDFDKNTLTGEYRMIGKDTYVRLDGLKNLDKILASFDIKDDDVNQTLVLFAPFLEKIDGQWIKADASSDQLTGGATGSLDVLNLSEEDGNKVAEIYQKYPVIEITEVLADEQVNGEDSKHFTARINKENYVAFLTELKDANVSALKVEQSDIEAAKDEDFSKINLEIWVRKSDKTINQVLISGDAEGTKIELRVALTAINEPVTIEVPEGAKSFEELFSNLLGGGGGPTASALLQSGM